MVPSLFILQDEISQADVHADEGERHGGASPTPRTASWVSLGEGWSPTCRTETQGTCLPRLGSQPSFPQPRRHPSHPATSRGDDCSANMYAQDLESGINHPASEESLCYVLTGRSELSRASRWNFNIQQDSGELKRKTALTQPPASAFYFQETGSRACASVFGAAGRWHGARACRSGAGSFAQSLIQSRGRKARPQPPLFAPEILLNSKTLRLLGTTSHGHEA